MSGNDEKEVKRVSLPACPRCGNNKWFRSQKVWEAEYLEEDDGVLYRYTGEEMVHSDEYTSWYCSHCDFEADWAERVMLDHAFTIAEWI